MFDIITISINFNFIQNIGLLIRWYNWQQLSDKFENHPHALYLFEWENSFSLKLIQIILEHIVHELMQEVLSVMQKDLLIGWELIAEFNGCLVNGKIDINIIHQFGMDSIF